MQKNQIVVAPLERVQSYMGFIIPDVSQGEKFSPMYDSFCPSAGHGKPNIDGFHLVSITVIKTFPHTSRKAVA